MMLPELGGFSSLLITEREYQPFSPLRNNLLFHLPFWEPLSFEITITHWPLSLLKKVLLINKTMLITWTITQSASNEEALRYIRDISTSSDRFGFYFRERYSRRLIIIAAIRRLLSPVNATQQCRAKTYSPWPGLIPSPTAIWWHWVAASERTCMIELSWNCTEDRYWTGHWRVH